MDHLPPPVPLLRRRTLLGGLFLAPLAAPRLQAQPAGEPALTTLAQGLDSPWALAFLPDGRLLVTERPGRLRLVEPGGRLGAPVEGLPPVDAGGQGGLLDVALAPDFERSRTLYLSYTEPGEGGRVNGTAVARGRLDGPRLAAVEVVFRQQPKVAGRHHFGSRLVFGRDGRLFVTLGDRLHRRDDAQDLSNHLGKIVRLERDGRAPRDNPLLGRDGVRPEIWSWGHRNVQGAALHPATGELWIHEHGPQGGDELNRALPGRNYGWPVITAGREYGSGRAIGEGTERAGVEPALRTWVPSVAPSGMAFLTGTRYPGWQGSLFIGTLRAQRLLRLGLDGSRITGEERLLAGLGERLRDVRQGPDGLLYLLSDEGRLLRLAA